MRKVISFIVFSAILLNTVLFSVPVGAVINETTLIDEVEALYFENSPSIDGYISEAEWGEASVVVESWDCATVDDTAEYHTFFYNNVGDVSGNRNGYDDFKYTVWFRWDLKKFYVGVKVNDPDMHCNKNGTGNTWNGDAIQMRVDKQGPNAVYSGQKFEVTESTKRPWSTSQVPDFLFGYVEIAGGFSEAWENVEDKGMTKYSNNPYGVADCVIAPAGSDYSSDTVAGITTYEMAIPWAYIYNGEFTELQMKNYAVGRDTATRGPSGAIGKKFGISMLAFNDGANSKVGWDAAMAWGSGMLNVQHELAPVTCTGSNSVTLVTTTVENAEYDTYDPTELLDAKFSTENLDEAGVFYDYLAGDVNKENPVAYSSLTTLKYDSANDLTIWGCDMYSGKIGKVSDSHGNVLDYRDNTDQDSAQTYIDSRIEETGGKYPVSFTFEFDIMYTGTEMVAEGYGSELYNWFGGGSGYSYMCGYFFEDGKFKIVNTNDETDVLSSYSYSLKQNNWYNWKFQYDNGSCSARLWIDDLSTASDNADCEWGTLVANANCRYFYYSSEQAKTEGYLLLYRMMNAQVAFDNVKVYNYARLANCTHAQTVTDKKNATCTEAGYETVTCYLCDAVISDKVISATGHTEVASNAEATYYADGYERTECSTCKAVLSETVIPRLSIAVKVNCVDTEGNTIKTSVINKYIDEECVIEIPEFEGCVLVPDDSYINNTVKVELYETPEITVTLRYERNVLRGDVNGDGAVNAMDINALCRYLVGMKTPFIAFNADLNSDGSVDGLDANVLRRMRVGI